MDKRILFDKTGGVKLQMRRSEIDLGKSLAGSFEC
jgi:hypothetical protein